MTTQYPAALARQPFSELNSSRLQSLTSLKNRQNAVPLSPSKRKAAIYEDDDVEEVRSVSFKFASPKRVKGDDGQAKREFDFKPSRFILTPASRLQQNTPFNAAYPPRRPALFARSPASVTKSYMPLQSSNLSRSSPLSAPAGRSPVRKRAGILNRRKAAGTCGTPVTRIDPPASRASSSIPFSLNAALNNTASSYSSRPRKAAPLTETLYAVPTKASWFFDIHEDTEAETMTNLMEHSTCILDISSDEESDRKKRDDRGKENIAPMDDVSQTSSTSLRTRDPETKISSSRRRKIAEGACGIDRAPLGDLEAEDYFAEGLDEKSVVLIEEEIEVLPQVQPQPQPTNIPSFQFTLPEDSGRSVEQFMEKEISAPRAAQPIEEAEEGLEV